MDLFRTMAAGSWLPQLAIASGALLLAAATARLARRWWRRDPALGYSLCVALLVGSLALLPVQWTVKGVGHALLAPWRAWWAERSAPVEQEPRPRLPFEDGAMLVDAPMGPADAARDAARREAEQPRHGRKGRAPEAYFTASLEERTAQDAHGKAVPAATKRTPSSNRSASSRSAGELLAAGFAEAKRWYAAVPKRETLLALWLAGGAWLLLARTRRLGRTMALVGRARRPTDPGLVALWRELVAAEPAAARVTLRVSSAVASPACFGWLRPVLLVPADPAPRLSLDALRWALRHELVHVARGDALVATLQAAATTLFWFHPAAWWLSSEVSRLRELSCDRSVVARCGRRRSYAHALLEHAALLNGHLSAIDAEPHSAGVRDALLHWGRSPSQIERRIEMLSMDSNEAPRGRRLGGRLLACSLFALPLLAQVGGAATLLPGDGTPAPSSVAAPLPPAPPALPVAQSAPVAAPGTPAPAAVARRGGDEVVAPSLPPPAPRARARVKRPASTVPAVAPVAPLPPPVEVGPASAPLAPRAPALPAAPAAQGGCALCTTPALAAAPAAECCTQDGGEKAKCTAGAACAEPAKSTSLQALGYVEEVDEVDELEALEELEELGYLDLEEFEDFADLSIDLQDDFADFEEEFADLSAEMAELELEAAQAQDVAAQMDQARAEVERALAQAQQDVDRELANADQQLAAALKAIDSADGLDDAERAKVKATIEKHMAKSRAAAKQAIDQSREKADRMAVEQKLAQRRAQGFTQDDRQNQQLQEALARMAQSQDEYARAAQKQAGARKQDEAKRVEVRKAATAAKRKAGVPVDEEMERVVAEKRAMSRKMDAAKVAEARKRAAVEADDVAVARKRADSRKREEATPADRQKVIRMQIEKLQQELMQLQDQLAELESASDVADDPKPAPPVKRGRSMR